MLDKLTWTHVAHAIPPAGVPLLVRAKDGTVCAAELLVTTPGRYWWVGVAFAGHEWEWDWPQENLDGTLRGVTHWMLLSSIPTPEAAGEPDA
jgi:hypothetical protein